MTPQRLRSEYSIKCLKGSVAPSLGQGYDLYIGANRLEPKDVKPKDIQQLRRPDNTTVASWTYTTMSQYSSSSEGFSVTASVNAKLADIKVGSKAEAMANDAVDFASLAKQIRQKEANKKWWQL